MEPLETCHTDFPGGILEPPNWQVFLVTPPTGKPPDVGSCPEFHRESARCGGSQVLTADSVYREYLPVSTAPGKSV
jgi:hypothetical protein